MPSSAAAVHQTMPDTAETTAAPDDVTVELADEAATAELEPVEFVLGLDAPEPEAVGAVPIGSSAPVALSDCRHPPPSLASDPDDDQLGED